MEENEGLKSSEIREAGIKGGEGAEGGNEG